MFQPTCRKLAPNKDQSSLENEERKKNKRRKKKRFSYLGSLLHPRRAISKGRQDSKFAHDESTKFVHLIILGSYLRRKRKHTPNTLVRAHIKSSIKWHSITKSRQLEKSLESLV